MGFGSKKKTKVGTSVSRVVEDNMLPNSPVSGTITGIFEDTSIPYNVLDALAGNIGVKAQKYYRRAEKHYPYGIPKEVRYSQSKGEEEAKNVLYGILGFDVSIEYSIIGPRNPIHYGWEQLVSQYNYNSIDNTVNYEIPVSGGQYITEENPKTYLVDMVYSVGTTQLAELDDRILDIWGVAAKAGDIPGIRPYRQFLSDVVMPSPYKEVRGSSAEKLIITFGTVRKLKRIFHGQSHDPIHPGKELIKEEVSLVIPALSEAQDGAYIQVAYVDAQGKRGFWSYRLGAGTYPSLDRLVDAPATEMGTHMPRMYYRTNKSPMDTNKESKGYKESVKLADILGIDHQEIIDKVNENPDIKDVEQAILNFAIPAVTSDPLEMEYLFEYFKRAFTFQDRKSAVINPTFFSTHFASARLSKPVSSIEIRDELFRMTLTHQGITKKLVKGALGKIGTHSMEYKTIDIPREQTYTDDSGREQIRRFTTKHPLYVYKKQISDHIVEEVSVMGLQLTYYIWQGHNVLADDDEDILMVPIDTAISNKMNLVKREKLYARSLHFVFNSRVTTKVKWYQRGIFKVFVVIVAIAIVVFTKGAAIKAALAVLAAGGAAATAMALTILKGFLVSLAITYGVKFAVKAVGIKNALILAAIAIAIAITGPDIGGLDSSLFAGDLLTAANGLVNEAMNAMQDKLIGVMDEMSAFQKEMEEATKTLETANELLYSSPILTPFAFIGEKPQDYYNRTIRSRNPGRESIEAVKNYYSNALRLPEFNDTIEGFTDD